MVKRADSGTPCALVPVNDRIPYVMYTACDPRKAYAVIVSARTSRLNIITIRTCYRLLIVSRRFYFSPGGRWEGEGPVHPLAGRGLTLHAGDARVIVPSRTSTSTSDVRALEPFRRAADDFIRRSTVKAHSQGSRTRLTPPR